MTLHSMPMRRAVVALGGNAITHSDDEGTVAQDYANLDHSLEPVVHLLERGYQLVITHGNGPQIGNQMIRVELSRNEVPVLPLDVMGADLQGGIGYMIERVLRSKLRARGMAMHVCCMLSMVEVASNDPAFSNPTKFVGPTYTREKAEVYMRERGWIMREDKGRGWRRVVPSPEPLAILERHEIMTLLKAGVVVISGGGGGIPISRNARGEPEGVEGVVDKDLTSAILALEIGAPELFILTAVPQVQLDFGTPQARPISRMTAIEARQQLEAGQFPPGSMGPKVLAACRFVEGGGGRALITDDAHLLAALNGNGGTWITG